MAASQSAAHFFGVATQQTALRTPELTGFTFIQGKAGGLALERPSKASDELCHYEQHFLRAQNSSTTGTLPLLLYFNQIGIFLDSFLHRDTAEQQSYQVTNAVNDKIDFDIGGGPLVADVVAGNYTTAGIGAAIATALNTADVGASTYSCTYSSVTKRFTIATNAATFNLQFASGPNVGISIGPLIGFTQDKTGAQSYLADEQAATVYSHIWSPHPTAQFEDMQANGLTLLDHRDWFTYRATGCTVTSLGIAYAENDPHAPGMTFGIKGCNLDRIAAVTPSISSDVPANPENNFNLIVIADGVSHSNFPTKNFNLTITPAVDMRWRIGDMYPVRIIHTGKLTTAATFAWDLENDDTADGAGTSNLNQDWETVWLSSQDTVSVEVLHTGELIRGITTESLRLTLPVMRPTGGTSQAALGTIEQPFSAMGQYDIDADSPGLQITIIGTEVLP